MGQALCGEADHSKEPTGKKVEVRWEPVVAQLELPFDFECDRENRVLAIAEGRALLEGDYLTHVDDVEVRAGCKEVMDAVDESRSLHTIRAQRQVVRTKGTSSFTVRLCPLDGKLGIGCTDTNVIRELYVGMAAEVDGRLQVSDVLLSVDGVDVFGGKRSLGEALKAGEARHVLVVQRKESKSVRNGTKGLKSKKKGDVATTSFTLSLSTAISGDGTRRLGLTLDESNRVVSFDTRHDELRLGDVVRSCDGHELVPPTALVDVLDPTLSVHEMRIERRVNKKKRDKALSDPASFVANARAANAPSEQQLSGDTASRGAASGDAAGEEEEADGESLAIAESASIVGAASAAAAAPSGALELDRDALQRLPCVASGALLAKLGAMGPPSASVAAVQAEQVALLLEVGKATAQHAEPERDYKLVCALFEEAFWRSGQYAHLLTAANVRAKLGEPEVALYLYGHVLERPALPEKLRRIARKKRKQMQAELPSVRAAEPPAGAAAGLQVAGTAAAPEQTCLDVYDFR